MRLVDIDDIRVMKFPSEEDDPSESDGEREYRNGWNDALTAINDIQPAAFKRLSSADPEIIHCGDCKYKDDGIDEDGIPFLKCLNGRSYGGTRINDYCSWAERRTDGVDS